MKFILNGTETVFEGNTEITLLDFLRRTNGVQVPAMACDGTGRCGACTVELDGRPVLSCSLPMHKVEECSIVTTDESSQMIQDIISFALQKTGIPECSYCVPETIMRARLFLQRNPDPTYEQSLLSVRHELCKCIGRKKIARSLVDAAGIIRDEEKAAACLTRVP
jgi:aerobic-type carbon monoxide dehydrogenase small subunit (CoxS/CutS family)